MVRNSQGRVRASETEAAWFSQMLMVLQCESDAVFFQLEAISVYRGNETAEQTVREGMTTLKELFLCLKMNEQQTFLLNSASERLLYLEQLLSPKVVLKALLLMFHLWTCSGIGKRPHCKEKISADIILREE